MSKHEYPETVVSSVEHTTEEVTDYAVDESVDLETTPDEHVEMSADIVEPLEIKGVVVDCGKLNIRNNPTSDAKVVATVPAGTEIVINEEESTDEFYKVCTAVGVEGFCMRRFIDILK